MRLPVPPHQENDCERQAALSPSATARRAGRTQGGAAKAHVPVIVFSGQPHMLCGFRDVTYPRGRSGSGTASVVALIKDAAEAVVVIPKSTHRDPGLSAHDG